jgi:hypothetical protein
MQTSKRLHSRDLWLSLTTKAGTARVFVAANSGQRPAEIRHDRPEISMKLWI